MNLFRSEEHAHQWALYDAAYDANLQSLAAYMERFSGERFRARIRPDYISWIHAQSQAAMIAGHVRRSIPAVVREAPKMARYATWLDTFGIDSDYDYDPFWAKCIELKVVPAAHSGGMDWGSRRSISNYMYNHIGHFASASEALCKSLFMGGVTRRFPALRVALLECGVGWACNLYADLVGHWEKRNRHDLENYDPANLDRNVLVDLFVPNFYFGCEADDRMNAWAFKQDVNPFDVHLNAIFSSDIGHQDVPDMTEVVEEAYELVERGVFTDADSRDFVFTNPTTLYAGTNPDFFKGTAVEGAVDTLMAP